MKIFLKIITPEKILFEGDVDSISLPADKGSFQIYVNHAPIVSKLDKGEVRVQASKQEVFNINGGVLNFENNKAAILTG